MIRKVLLLILATTFVIAISEAPIPHCVAHDFALEGPLSVGEKITFGLNRMFSGYNLNLTLASNNSIGKLVGRIEKIDEQAGHYHNVIDQHIEHDGNGWGKDSYILYHDSTQTIFQYGVVNSQAHLPEFNLTVIVSNDTDLHCFGAALMLDYGLAIVDCIRNIVDSGVNKHQNEFHYVDLTNSTITKVVKNSLYVKYSSVTRRKILQFVDRFSGHHYILRTYLSYGVNKDMSDNTYL